MRQRALNGQEVEVVSLMSMAGSRAAVGTDDSVPSEVSRMLNDTEEWPQNKKAQY